jgi:hypothetical protein
MIVMLIAHKEKNVSQYSVFLAFRLAFQNYDRSPLFIDRKAIVFKDSARTNRLRLSPKWSIRFPRMRFPFREASPTVETKTEIVGSKKTPLTSAKFDLTVFKCDRTGGNFSFFGNAIGLKIFRVIHHNNPIAADEKNGYNPKQFLVTAEQERQAAFYSNS